MKKLTALFVITFALLLNACGKGDDAKQDESQPAAGVTETTADVATDDDNDADASPDLKEATELYKNKEYEKAFPLYEQAANAGNALAQRRLGHMYYKGLGVAQDDKQARVWYEKAAAQGDKRAQKVLDGKLAD